MRPRRSVILIIFALVALRSASASTARADHRTDLEEAKRVLDHANHRLAHASAALSAAQCALDSARASRDRAARELDDTLDSAHRLGEWLAGAEDELRQAADALAALEREAAARQGAHDDAERRVDETAAALRQLRDDAWGQFARSPEFVEAERLVARQQARLEAHVDEVNQRLASDPRQQQLEDDARRAEDAVNALRDDPRADPGELASASQSWIDAKSRARANRNAAIDADPAVQQARAALDDAERRRASLVQAFEQAFERDPQTREATDRFRDAERTLAGEIGALRDVLAARDEAGRRLAWLDSQFKGNESALAHAHANADALRRAIDAAEHDARRAAHHLSSAIHYHADAARARELAERRYREAKDRCDEEERRQYHPKQEPDDRGDRYKPGGKFHRGDNDDGVDDRKKRGGSPEVETRLGQRFLEDERGRKQREEEAKRKQDEARRAEQERREAEWQKRREENKRREEQQAKKKNEPTPEPKPEPKPEKNLEAREQPKPKPEAKQQAPSKPPPREEAKKPVDSAKKEDPRKPDPKKPEEPKDRGDRYRKGK